MDYDFNEWKPKDFAFRSDYVSMHGPSKNDDSMIKYNQNTFVDPMFKEIEDHKTYYEYSDDMTWLELFAKLDFEEFLTIFPMLNSLKYLYDYIHACKDRIKSLFLKIEHKRSLKSGYYFLMILLTNMTNLETLILCDEENRLGAAYKFLIKGFANFNKNGGSLRKLILHKVATGYATNGILNILKQLPDLEVVQTNGSSLNDEAGKSLGKILSDYRNIRELDLSNTSYYDQQAKEIADGLMRAKKLEVLKMRFNSSLYNGISPILYNLAFAPRIKLIDLTSCSIGGNSNACEAVYKLVKISGSLEHLILNNTGAFNNITRDFFIALGENKTLKSLHLDAVSRYSNSFCNDLGKAVAMNAKKSGSLETLSCKNGFNMNSLNMFVDNLHISEQDHEYWYGDVSTARNMEKEDLEKKLYCNIKQLDLERCDLTFYGSIADIEKSINPKWPQLVKLFANQITSFNMAKANVTGKKSMELICKCINNPIEKTKVNRLNLCGNRIDKEGAKILCDILKQQFTLTHLDLSGNKLGVSGCKSIAQALLNNTSLRYLNLYSNQVDVDGARCLKETLLANDTLEYLDVGSNRLRDKGVLAIAEGIVGNKTCALKGIGIRYNFITDDGAEKFFEIILENSKIDKVFARNNYLTEPYLTNLHKIIDAHDSKIFVDCLEKMKYLDEDLLSRSIWISPISSAFTPLAIKNFFQETHKCGVVINVRVYQGNKLDYKPKENWYAIVEFVDEDSVARALRVASAKKSILMGVRFRIYKAGTAHFGTASAPAVSRAKRPETRHTGRGGFGGRGRVSRGRFYRGRGGRGRR